MKFDRVFTANFSIENIQYTNIPCEMKDERGNIVFSCKNLEVPSHWAMEAIENIVEKHLLKRKLVPAILKKIAEHDLPIWLQRNVANAEEMSLLPPEDQFVTETSIKQIINRIVLSWLYNGYKNKYFDTETDAKVFYEEMFYILIYQIALPAKIQMTNQGLYWAYGITNPLNYYFLPQLNDNISDDANFQNKEILFSSFILATDNSVTDDDGLIALLNNEAKLLSCSISCTTNYSRVKSKNEINTTGVYAGGVLNFLHVSDKLATTIKTNPTNYNISKLAILNDNHPDILEFIYWKVKAEQQMISMFTGSHITHKIFTDIYEKCTNPEEQINIEDNIELKRNLFLAQILKIPAKFIKKILSLSCNKEEYYNLQTYANLAEYYNNVFGYKTSLSVRISNKFLNHVQNNDMWTLKSVTTAKETKNLPSSFLMQHICYASWVCSEPSVQFDTTINEWNTCPNSGYISASSQNEAYIFLDNTTSAFANIDLLKFRNNDATFNIDKFFHVIKLLIIAQDILFFMALYPNKSTAKETLNYRPISLGYCNFSAYLMSIGVPYYSDKARAICAAITSLLTGYAYLSSSLIAAKLGSFPKYKENKQNILNILHNYKETATAGKNFKGLTIHPVPFQKELCSDINLKNNAISVWDDVLNLCTKHGLRNAQLTSLSWKNCMEGIKSNITSSVIPSFGIITHRKDRDGQYTKQILPVVFVGLKKLGYTETQIDEIVKYVCGHNTLQNCPYINRESLNKKGFTKDIINKVETLLANVFNIEFVFNLYILGEPFCANVLKLNVDELKNPNISLLQKIGFSKQEIIAANKYITGYATMKGAPFIREEHIKIFDAISTSNDNKENYVDQIKMIASAQSFITGAVSHIVLLPVNATIADFKTAYLLAWQYGIKTIRLYREGFKISQTIQHDLLQDENLFTIDLLTKENNELIANLLRRNNI